MRAEIRIRFCDVSPAEQSRLAGSLEDALRTVRGVETCVVRERTETQDPGTIVSVILGAPAVVLAVKALANWATRTNQGSVEIADVRGTSIIRNINSEDIPKVIQALREHLETAKNQQ
jgi:dissimilatory sulfite reductase (desulfoviridin) alpha/beta subunit